jgi:hypothetical protein
MDPLETKDTPPADLEERRRRSIAEQAGEAETEPPADGDTELFPLGSIEGDELTPQKIIKRGLPVEVTVSIGKAEVPVKGNGLMDPEKTGRVIVSYAFASNTEIPTTDETGRVVSWKVRQSLRATHVAPANDREALIRAEFDALLALEGDAAGRLLDELKARFGQHAA